jgi:cytosine/adenosine deaminase-related metal-dependent hydrolase
MVVITEGDNGDVVDATGMIMLPGLVNCHVHTV